jgi:heme-degrading monooxygenase HmoA
MFAVIFEVQPKAERRNDYLELAKALKPKLEAIDGFIDVERYESKRTKGRMLSLSIWRDEKAVVRWRTQAEHHGAQEKGRFEIFDDYRLRVGEVTDDSASPPGAALPQQRFDETANADAKAASITELTPPDGAGATIEPKNLAAQLGLDSRAVGVVDQDVFESIYNPGKLILLVTWRDSKALAAWTPAAPQPAGALRHRRVRIIRDYGLADRREAPQFYAEVRRAQNVAAE